MAVYTHMASVGMPKTYRTSLPISLRLIPHSSRLNLTKQMPVFEWQEDSLAAAANNAQVEAAAFTVGTLTATTMRTKQHSNSVKGI